MVSGGILFLVAIAQCYVPGKGFTIMLAFGSEQLWERLPEVRQVNLQEVPGVGYDGQFYAQIAMRPDVTDPELGAAVDAIEYRARRILLPLVAWTLALGEPVRALHVYSVLNVGTWLVLAVLLLRWLPPRRWSNVVRWFGIMFSCGMCVSVRNALVDGPSLLLVAIAVALVERGRTWIAAMVLAAAGLAKETNLLAASVLGPEELRASRAWRRAIVQGVFVGLPVFLWFAYLARVLDSDSQLGLGNFDWPLMGFAARWGEIWEAADWGDLLRPGFPLWVHMGLLVQLLYFVLRPDWKNLWWRLGTSYCALLLILGDAVWEGVPGAACRVLLPMTLAFNLLVPYRRALIPVLLLGNLGVLPALEVLAPPARAAYAISGPPNLQLAENTGEKVRVTFDGQWYGAERSFSDVWQWSRGNASMLLHNPHNRPLRVLVTFGLGSNMLRHVSIEQEARVLWQGTVHQQQERIRIEVVLMPGDTVWRFVTPTPAERPDGDLRSVAFAVRDLTVHLVAMEEASAQVPEANAPPR